MVKSVASIYDIARLAGVSNATVSNVLNDKGRMSQRTRERVLAIAREQGYVPSFAAKSLRERRTSSIGIITPDVSNDFYSSIVLEVETRLHEAGYDSYICNSSNSAERELSYVRGLLHKQVDGFVLVGGSAQIGSVELGSGVPAVLIDRPVSTLSAAPNHVGVGNDIHALVGSMVGVLAGHGCERIAYVNVSSRQDDAAGRLRYGGYVDGLAACGLPPSQDLVFEAPHRKKSYDEAAQAVGDALGAGLVFDGIACMGDRLALGATAVIKRCGLVPGRDVLVMGMDDSLYSRIVSPSISSVDRNAAQMAHVGVDVLLALLGDEPASGVVVPYAIVERETTLGVGGNARRKS